MADAVSAVDFATWSCAGVGYAPGGPYAAANANGRFKHNPADFAPHYTATTSNSAAAQYSNQYAQQQQRGVQHLYSSGNGHAVGAAVPPYPPSNPPSAAENGVSMNPSHPSVAQGRWVWQAEQNAYDAATAAAAAAAAAQSHIDALNAAQVSCNHWRLNQSMLLQCVCSVCSVHSICAIVYSRVVRDASIA